MSKFSYRAALRLGASVAWAVLVPATQAFAGDTTTAGAGAADAGVAADAGSILVTGVRPPSTVLPTRPPASIYGFNESVLDTPRTVSEISADQLAHDPISTTDDYIKYAPGITQGGGQSNDAAPTLRGLTSEVFQNGQRIYKDGNDHPLNLNAFESADIVEGAPTEVFGPSSGTGGYVNYITKKPYFDRQHLSVTADLGTWVPGTQDNYANFKLNVDAGGPITDNLAYRVSYTGQRGRTFYTTVRDDFNSAYGALTWKPASNVTVDWNFSYDDYYDFNISRGWNRPTQALVDSFGGEYYGGRATPLIKLANGEIISPVFTSSNPTAAPVGYQIRTANAQHQYIAGATILGALPNATAANAGSIVGWVYDPSIPGNGLTSIDPATGSGQASDKDSALRIISQLQVAVDLGEDWNILSSTYFQRSINLNNSVGSFLYQNRSTLVDHRDELRTTKQFSLFGVPITWEGNNGITGRFLDYTALSANNNFNYNPYDLSLNSDDINPGALLGLTQGAASGSWIGAPGVPQLSSYFGYLKLPTMVAVNNGYYSELGGYPPSGAVYTSTGYIHQIGFFNQENFKIGKFVGINLGFDYTHVMAHIANPVYLTAAQQYSDTEAYNLPSYQGSIYVKPTSDTTLYFTYDHSLAVNTGTFGSFLTWGPGNKLNPLAFKSLSLLYEAGFKWTVIPQKLFFTADIYSQARDTAPDTNGNMAHELMRGLESSLRYQPTAQAQLGLNLSWLNPIYTYVVPSGFSPFGFYADNETVFGDSNALNKRLGGRYEVPGIPHFTLSGFADYHLRNGLGAQLTAWYTSSWATNLSQSVWIRPSYRTDLSLYYRRPTYDVTLRILNLTNAHDYENALAGGEFLLPMPPRSVEARIAYHF